MIFDTGSYWVWVNSRFCENCPSANKKFDERTSKTFNFTNVVVDLHYGSGDAYGFNSFDQVCLTQTACAQNFSFLTVGMQKGLSSLSSSGIIGLSSNDGGSRGDLFIQKMKKSGVIKKALFALKLDVKNDNSSMTIGDYNMTQFA